ncbi:unnamed protein product [Musa acuminata subsp. burmannicoides]
MTNARIDDLEKRLTGLEKELRGGLEDLNSRMLSRFTDVDRRVEVVLHKLEGCGIVRRSDDALLKRIRDVIWSYCFSSTWTIGATVKTEDARSADWREEVYREIQDINKHYFEELNEIHQKLTPSWQQLQSLLSAKANQSLGHIMNKIDHILKALQYSKSDIQPDLKDMLPVYEKIIILYLALCKKYIKPLLSYLSQQEQPQGPQLRLLDGCTDNQMNMQSSETSVQPAKNLPCLAACEEATSDDENAERMRSDIVPPKEATPDNEYKKRMRSDIVPPKKATPDNEHEKRMRSYIVPPKEIRVTFDDIGALDETKKLLHELIILPLQRPELFKGLLEPSRGILLFGPPGTGKTMLAKALAHEAGATFINVSMSAIASKWFGHSESNARALFTLAAKVAPTIIFIDEVDCILGQKTSERDTMASVTNEFLIHWDGLLTKSEDRILVLAATNRPFNLDEAIIRRFEHRIMVGLPSQESRESILRTLLSKEKTEQLDFKELATMTVGYSGSDLKNLCVAAAYRPLRELIQREQSTRLVAKSCATKSYLAEQLEEWNKSFGDGGSRKQQQLSYYI